MIAPLAKFIDWYALQFFWTLRLKSVGKWRVDAVNSKLAEALQFLNSPDFIPAESRPAQVLFTDSKHFTFPTPRPYEFAENNTVYGRLYRCAGNWQKHPVIILLHGGGDFLNHRLRFPWMVPACNRAGFNAATLVAPCHFQRRPRRLGGWDYLRTARAFAQGVAEIRALTGWFLDQGCPSVALFGVSLGGWFAGLTATSDPRLTAIVMVVPAVRTNYRVTRGEGILWTPVRKAFERQKAAREALDKTPMNLTLSQPVIPKENILLVQGRYDLFVEPENTEDLWQKWKHPDIWRLPHGHLSTLLTPGLTDRVLCWLALRLEVP